MTIDEFLTSLPDDRRAAITAVRKVIQKKLPKGYEEGFLYGGISWFVPKTRLPKTYNNQPLTLTTLGSQKNYMVLHLMPVYGDKKLHDWFVKAYTATGKKLDMGKACLRFKKLDDLPLDVIGDLIAKVSVDGYVEAYEKSRTPAARKKK